MEGLSSQLWSCLLDALVLYPLVYLGRVLDMFKLCCFLRRDSWIPDRGYILRCFLAALLLVYGAHCFLTSKMVTDWMSGYHYDLNRSHRLKLEEKYRAIYYSSEHNFSSEMSNFTTSFSYIGDDAIIEWSFPVQRDSRRDSLFVVTCLLSDTNLKSGFSHINSSHRHHMQSMFIGNTVLAQLTIISVSINDFGIYKCAILDSKVKEFTLDARYHLLLEIKSPFIRLTVPPGGILRLNLQAASTYNPIYTTPEMHYKINDEIDPAYQQESTGCSPFLNAINYMIEYDYISKLLGTWDITLPAKLNDSHGTDEFDRLYEINLHLHFCLSPERFGMYSFFSSRSYYNFSTKAREQVTAKHPWTILVTPKIPAILNWFLPGYRSTEPSTLIVLRDKDFADRNREVFDSEDLVNSAYVVMVMQYCVFFLLVPSLCLVGLYIYSQYAPRLTLVLWRYLIKIMSMFLPVHVHKPQAHPAIASVNYDLWVLSSDDSKYWVKEHVISYTRGLKLQVFWEELLTPGVYRLSSSLDALHQAKKIIVIISPESAEDGYFCHQFECVSLRVIEDRLSPLDVMLVRLGNASVDKFRRHNQFEFFDWNNTVFRREAFRRKISQWLNR